MRVIVNDKMKEWVAAYIRAHRVESCISIHVVYSKFNEDFRATFKTDPFTVVQLMIAAGFLNGCPAKGGFSIWLPEDAGKGQRRPFHPRPKPASAPVAPVVKKTEMPALPAQKGESEMKKKLKDVVAIEPTYAFERIPHPETGVVDVLALIQYIMEGAVKHLPSGAEIDGGYFVSGISLNKLFEDIGVPESVRPQLTHIMSRMGLLKKYGRMSWGLLEKKALAFFITPRLYIMARDSYIAHTTRNHEIARLRVRLEKLTASPRIRESTAVAESTSSGSASFEGEAMELLAEAERISEERARVQETLKTVEGELAKVRETLKVVESERDKLALELKSRPAPAEVYRQEFSDRIAKLKQSR